MTMLAVRPTMVYNILRYCTGSNLWTNWSQELGDIEICVALCMSVGAGRGNFPDPPRTTSSNGVPAAERRQPSQGWSGGGQTQCASATAPSTHRGKQTDATRAGTRALTHTAFGLPPLLPADRPVKVAIR